MSSQTIEKKTNSAGYPTLDVDNVRELLGDRIMVAWEEGADEIKAGKIKLLRPDTHKKAHFTGHILMLGLGVETDALRDAVAEGVKKGERVRILFDQFSNFEKFFDEKYGRVAIIREKDQGSAFAIIPERAKIGGGEGDFNYDL